MKRGAGLVVGYVRVSSLDQNTTRQLDGLTLDRIFSDQASGRDTKRPELASMLLFVREGDEVVIHSIDRLARNLDDLRRIVSGLTERGVKVRFQKENLVFTGDDSPMSQLLLSMLGAVAQFERDLIRERQREGIALAKLKGTYGRKPHSLQPWQRADIVKRLDQGESPSKIAKEYNVHRQTIYRAREAKA